MLEVDASEKLAQRTASIGICKVTGALSQCDKVRKARVIGYAIRCIPLPYDFGFFLMI